MGNLEKAKVNALKRAEILKRLGINRQFLEDDPFTVCKLFGFSLETMREIAEAQHDISAAARIWAFRAWGLGEDIIDSRYQVQVLEINKGGFAHFDVTDLLMAKRTSIHVEHPDEFITGTKL
jgi:hypothetical protein